MSEQQTAGLLTIGCMEHDDWGLIRGADGGPVASTFFEFRTSENEKEECRENRTTTAEVEANARHLVACWNFCGPVPTETLETCQGDLQDILANYAMQQAELKRVGQVAASRVGADPELRTLLLYEFGTTDPLILKDVVTDQRERRDAMRAINAELLAECKASVENCFSCRAYHHESVARCAQCRRFLALIAKALHA